MQLKIGQISNLTSPPGRKQFAAWSSLLWKSKQKDTAAGTNKFYCGIKLQNMAVIARASDG
jgi:hypothetical protein